MCNLCKTKSLSLRFLGGVMVSRERKRWVRWRAHRANLHHKVGAAGRGRGGMARRSPSSLTVQGNW